MKKKCIYVLIIIILSFSIIACFSTDNDDTMKLLEIEQIPEEVIEQAKEEKPYIIEKYPITQEDLEQTIKIIMEDDIWFEVEKSDFYSYINKDIDFEYYYNEEYDCIYVMPHIDPDKRGIFRGNYLVLRVGILDGRLLKSYDHRGSSNFDEVRAEYLPQITGSGTVSIGERRKPQYDATEEEIADAVKNVQEGLESQRKIGGGSERENVFIRNFYKGEEETVEVYTAKGKQWRYSIFIKTGTQSSARPSVEADEEYLNRLLECSIAVEKEKPLDKEAENALEAMIKQKTEQALKTLIDDDIWFKNEKSLFYSYRNKEIAYQYYYEYYYNRKSGFVYAFPLIESEGETVFSRITFYVSDEKLEEGLFHDDEEGVSYELDNIQGSGTVSIGERRKPPYDADKEEVETVKENIRKYVEYEKEFHAEYKMEWEMEDIYVRNFYQGAINTMMIYTSKGKRHYTYIDTNGESHGGGHEIEESQKEYYDRIIECSFPLYD